MTYEYAIRYREASPFWRGRGTEHIMAVGDGTLEAASFAANGYMVSGFRGVQIVKRADGGSWTRLCKVNPGRLLLRKIRQRASGGPAWEPLPDGFTLTETTPGAWRLNLPDRDGMGGFLQGPDPVSLRRSAWAIDDLAAEGYLTAAVQQLSANLPFPRASGRAS